MSRILGAPRGGTTRGGQKGLESAAVSWITPPNGTGGGGSCFPLIVIVASDAPGTPLICWAEARRAASAVKEMTTTNQLFNAAVMDRIYRLDLALWNVMSFLHANLLLRRHE